MSGVATHGSGDSAHFARSLNFMVTPEGGWAFRLVNRTGATSVKGEAIMLSDDYDDSFVKATDAEGAFIVNGFVYDEGVPDGQECWVVRDGIAEVLLEDGYGAPRNGWVRLSPATPGRCIVFSRPGYDVIPSSVDYQGKGETISGSLFLLASKGGGELLVGEAPAAAGAPGMTAKFVFEVSELPASILLDGYYDDGHTESVVVQVRNFALGTWEDKGTMEVNRTSNESFVITGLTADNLDAGEVWVQLYHADVGNPAHRIHVDRLVAHFADDNEHFKECGHTTRAASAGKNVLVRANIHFL